MIQGERDWEIKKRGVIRKESDTAVTEKYPERIVKNDHNTC
jgi:hypothetical protein